MVRDRVDGGGDGRAWRSAVRKLRSEGAVGVCALVHLPVPRAAPVGQWMGNAACGSNVKDKLEAGKLYLHVQGFPDPLAPIGDVDSPFGIDMAIPEVNGRAHYSNAAGWHLYYVQIVRGQGAWLLTTAYQQDALACAACLRTSGLGLHRGAVLGPKRWLLWNGSRYVPTTLSVTTLDRRQRDAQAQEAADASAAAYPNGVGRPEVALGPETWHLVATDGSDHAGFDATHSDGSVSAGGAWTS